MPLLDEYPGWYLQDASPLYALGDIVFGAEDPYGVTWHVKNEDGWSSSSGTTAAIATREDADGAWPGPTRYGPRTVTLSGVAVAPKAKDRFNAVCASATGDVLRVEERHLTRRATVQRNGQSTVGDTGMTAFQWAIQLTATDHRRYADALSTTASDLSGVGATSGRPYPRRYPLSYGGGDPTKRGLITATNVGNTTAGGVLSVFGPITDPSVTQMTTGRRLGMSLVLNVGDQLDIDLDTHTVILNGFTSRRSFLTTAQWFRLAPGDNLLKFSGTQHLAANPPTIPYPRVSLAYRSAWL
jgi:hypothetical protein